MPTPGSSIGVSTKLAGQYSRKLPYRGKYAKRDDQCQQDGGVEEHHRYHTAFTRKLIS